MTNTIPVNPEREAKSKAVAKAVAALGDKLGYDPDIVFEGAVRGAAALMLSRGTSAADVAQLFEKCARMIGTLDQDN